MLQYYVCSARYRYGTAFCPGERLPKEELEEAVIEQMADVFQNTSLLAEALESARIDGSDPAEEEARRLTGIRKQLAGARRALDRYFAAFEEGTLSAADYQDRIAELKTRVDALLAEEASLVQRARQGESEMLSAEDIGEWASDLGELLRAGSAQQRKALFRLLIKELKVMGRDEILPTYRVPALVRAPDGQVVPTGFEPVSPP